MENKIYSYWLCSIPGVGNRTIEKLKKAFGSAEQIYHSSEKEWDRILTPAQLEEMKKHKAEWKVQEEYNRMQANGIQFILKEEAEYPHRLLNIPDAPYAIFLKGKLPVEDKMSVAIIGARDCSEYGRYVAQALGSCLGENDVQVISGMARGIDGISQSAALKVGGTSFAVLGSGVDVCYPVQNKPLYNQIQERGGILSVYPPGTVARPQNFPPRNRIVSGLADVIVVIEARQKSGTLITVDMALEQGKEVYVVPGRITDRLSDGCNRLLKQGAGVVLSPEAFLTEIKELWETQRSCMRETFDTKSAKAARPAENLKLAGAAKVMGEEKPAEATKVTGEEKLAGATKVKGEEKPAETAKITCSLSPELQPIYNILDFYPQSVEQLLSRLPGNYTIASLNTALMRLCLENYALQVSPGHFCLGASQ